MTTFDTRLDTGATGTGRPGPADILFLLPQPGTNGAGTGTSATTGTTRTGGPLVVAQTAPIDVIDAAREALTPDALVFGATTPRMPGGVPGWLAPAGNFALYGLENGNWSYFGARPVQPLPPIPTPWGPIRQGLSYVGTAGQAADGSFTDQAGVGWTAVIPSPSGDILLFANSRQDALTIGNAIQDRGRHIVNVNFGAAYALNDGAARLLATKFPGAALVIEGASQVTGANVWGGVGYSEVPIQMVIENGAPSALIINGNEIPMDQLAALFGDEIESRALSGGFMPQSLNNSVLRDFDPRHTNLTQEGSDWRRVIERAFERGVSDPAQQYDLMLQALENPQAVFGDLPPEGRKAALVLVNAMLGRTDEANRLAAELYPFDNTVDGLRPRGLQTLRIDELAALDGARAGGERISYGWVGVPGIGQAELRYDPAAERYSVHGRNGAQHPLPNAGSLEDAREQARALIRGGGFSPENVFPLAGYDGTPIATIPDDQPTRIGQGWAGVPGVGQLEIRWDSRTGDYSAHGPNDAQYPLPGVDTADEARARVREMIRNGGVSPQNMFPLAGPPVANIPTDQATRIGQGYAGVEGIGQLEIRWDSRTGDYSAHGPNGAQYPLPDATTLGEARERVREMIRNGGVSPQNMFPL
ncbi:hypothetical protein ACTZWW_15215 [Salinarimonas sp. NSM]|uniref:hypothetical protein n=1 Tax=Salinarimonas sp. NSM TaxID=3458003 RepID=UPI0040375DA4